ncbi:glycosyltransferase [Cellulomonas sp. GbtcB1]|uniref:glycosyltransferase n=1 Tax=Cellulomonas sp. GbtcB1 TaxID=2824746 RepID=UPI001C30C3E0|nr:glycosyltransferase [Cellulomonas sp. GbtcB1]
MDILVVTTSGTAARARSTVRSALPFGPVTVLDLDGGYPAVGGERVLPPAGIPVTTRELHLWAVRHPLSVVRSRAAQHHLAHREPGGAPVLVVEPGVLLLSAPDRLAEAAEHAGLALVARSGALPHDGRRPTPADLLRAGAHTPALLAVRPDRDDALAAWADGLLATEDAGAWTSLVAGTVPHSVLRDPAVLVSPWSLVPEHVVTEAGDGRLLLGGRPVTALDLVHADPAVPWLLDAGVTGDPRARLSDHPVLAGRVAAALARVAADEELAPSGAEIWARTSLGGRVDAPLRTLWAATDDAPDPFDPARSAELLDWLTAPAADGGLSRYLRAVRAGRPDLAGFFAGVPGRDEEAYVTWAEEHAAAEGFDGDLVAESVRRWTAPPPPPATYEPGVNVVGFLRGELGIGESARLLVQALDAAGVPRVTVPVDTHLSSRQRRDDGRAATREAPLATTVLCVNSDLTPTVASALPVAYDGTYRIGMWYWEVEEFPPSQHGGLASVDEVWVATDFVRAAIEPHTELPVRTLTPPLPQRPGAPALTRADLGLPEGTLFLFAFDFLSTAERKNPLGLVDAFCAAFGPEDGPVLVVKSINADLRPAEAERLRLRVAGLPHVRLVEEYLDADARDALMAACDCYVSLHRSGGLGLTMAEAMAWGKPVIATRYSGNLQFMTDANSYLVDWKPTPVPADAAPYPAGSTWADPDLAHAARLMREVV